MLFKVYSLCLLYKRQWQETFSFLVNIYRHIEYIMTLTRSVTFFNLRLSVYLHDTKTKNFIYMYFMKRAKLSDWQNLFPIFHDQALF